MAKKVRSHTMKVTVKDSTTPELFERIDSVPVSDRAEVMRLIGQMYCILVKARHFPDIALVPGLNQSPPASDMNKPPATSNVSNPAKRAFTDTDASVKSAFDEVLNQPSHDLDPSVLFSNIKVS
jgi:hypothetical protein